MKFPLNENETMEFLIESSKGNSAQRNRLERFADEIGYPYDAKEYEYRTREYSTIEEIVYNKEDYDDPAKYL